MSNIAKTIASENTIPEIRKELAKYDGMYNTMFGYKINDVEVFGSTLRILMKDYSVLEISELEVLNA